MTALPIPRLNFKSVSTTSPIKKKGKKKIITRRKNLKKRNVEKRRAAAAMGGGGGGGGKGGTTRESRREGGIKRKNKRKETVECVSRSYRVPRQLFWKSGAVTALLNGEFPPPVSTVRFRACAGLPQCNREKARVRPIRVGSLVVSRVSVVYRQRILSMVAGTRYAYNVIRMDIGLIRIGVYIRGV